MMTGKKLWLNRKEKKEWARRLQSEDPGLEVVHQHAAGIDVGNGVHYVAVRPDRDPQPVRRFECFTADLHRLADWLRSCGVRTVAMQSTGVYWIPIYEILEERGFQVYLVNARHTKNLPGRKSDVQESQWLLKLHTYGLLNNSFQPPGDSCTSYLLAATRRTRAWSSDLHSDPRVHASREEVAKSLEGNWRPELLFVLQQEVEMYDAYQQRITECDRQLQKHLARLADAVPQPTEVEPKRKKTKLAKNAPRFELGKELQRITGVDLTRIDGIDVIVAQTLVSEVGLDMSRWKTESHFASWLGLCPDNRISGDKVLSRGTRRVVNRAATALRMAAITLMRSRTYLGAQYRRLRTKLGAPKAITAMAHRLARLVYRMLKYGHGYLDKGADYYEHRYRQQQIQFLMKKAAKLSLQITPAQS
jgi:transposase